MGAITVPNLLAFDGGTFTSAITGIGSAMDAMSSARGTLTGAAGNMQTWTSAAGAAAIATVNNIGEAIGATPSLLSDAQDTVSSFVAAITQQQDLVKGKKATAESLHCSVEDDGTVSPPPAPSAPPAGPANPSPDQAAAQAQAQSAFQQQMAAWENVCNQAIGLEADIKQALATVASKDGQAASYLGAASDASHQTTTIVAGQDGSGAAIIALQNDEDVAEGGEQWAQSFVNQAVSLVNRAAAGDPSATSQLQDLKALSYDQDFSTSLVNTLGPANLKNLPYEMGNKLPKDGGKSTNAALGRDQQLLAFLSDSLASASNDPSIDAGQLAQSLINAPSDAQGSTDASLWGLGQILGAGTGAVQFNSAFMNPVGDALKTADQAYLKSNDGHEYNGPFVGVGSDFANNLNLPAGTDVTNASTYLGQADTGGNPLYGFLHAEGVSPEASLSWLGQQPNGQFSNLDYLMQRKWPADNGYTLGQAIAAGADQPGTRAAALSAQAVKDFMPHVEKGGKVVSYNGGGLSGMNGSLGQVLGYHAQDLYDSYNGTGPFPNQNTGLAFLLASVESDPTGYQALMAGSMPVLKNALIMSDQGALASGDSMQGRLSQFQGEVGTLSNYLGYLVAAHDVGLKAAGATQDAATQASSSVWSLSNLVNQGIGLIPIPGNALLSSVAKTAIGDALSSASSSSPSTAGYTGALFHGAQDESGAAQLMQQLVASTMISQGLFNQTPQDHNSPQDWLNANPGQPSFFTRTPSGGFVVDQHLNTAQATALQEYLKGGKTTQSFEHGALGTIGNSAAGSSVNLASGANKDNVTSQLGASYPGLNPSGS